ncbi:hypothetical protein SAMN02799630_01936 [Paenibacillus sp. UNCCL117]|uniref:COG1470 family protein n=1 Tax=unclassified Paenibacillus TaxID=185978 RepID=UPI0008926BCA|nr:MULTISPECIES: hypothetical protein [unclassified Paenibacillus]SDD06555.1 hypothetical protein SAMN04488602_105193 [Paenibacillus sp. cl123]SFW31664.1 hypothetical protein SAMN02799630_01936 [Paenibacillus sp. UNCCL117]
MSVLTSVDVLKDWSIRGQRLDQGYELAQGLCAEFPAPAGAKGWYPIGFEQGNDCAVDVMGWFGLKLTILARDEHTEIAVKASFMDNFHVIAPLLLAGPGRQEVTVRLLDFSVETAKANIWRFLKRLSWSGNAALLEARLMRGEKLFIASEVRGKSGDVGESVVYKMTVHNCTEVKQSVAVRQLFTGWESLLANITPSSFVLEPYGSKAITVAVDVHANIVPGGHEKTMLRFTANGDGASSEQIELLTLRRLPHPYIYHNEHQWAETKRKIDRYPPFKPGYDQIIADAEAWIVKPPVPVEERDYCYDTGEEHYIMSAAYAYALTKELRYAEKVAAFLRYFTDEETGYPRKKKGCSQSYVQEGHFFQHLAIPYDIIHSSGVLTAEDHRAVEQTFRIYMDVLDHHIRRGHISNWLLSEITGAFYCALALQDMERALRFVFGPMGSIDQLKYGLFNDGWWYECSVGYNNWVSSLYIHTAHALLPFGINLLHQHFSIPYNDEVNSTYNGEDAPVRFGMYNKKWGGRVKNYVCIKDMFDATIPFLDYRGVLFGISDSEEKKLEGVHFGSTFDLAYQYYKDPAYIPVIRQNSYVDPIFGHAELPDIEPSYAAKNAYADNVGIAMLRSQTAGREQQDQIQAVIRYGSHGYAHGHFDRTGLLSVMRYGRSFFNPEHVWWGYPHFMYKFYVQNSITKNMVVVDEKMQVPSDSRRLLFYSGRMLQATAVETISPWSYPPYGGMVYNDGESLEERCRINACSLPEVQDGPPYGELSGFTEPVVQRRVMAVTDDYIVLFDSLEGESEHQFDSLFQGKGFQGIRPGERGSLNYLKHTSQLTDDQLSDAQFVTDCHWHEADGGATASFVTVFGEGEDMRGNRSNHNTPGLLRMDVHTAWPPQAVHIIGRAAECHGVAIPLKYGVEVDGELRAAGEFGAWLLGEGKCDVELQGARELKLRVTNGPVYNEQKYPLKTKQALFWGEAVIMTSDGRQLPLSELAYRVDNVDPGQGVGRDYEGGRVTIVGNAYPRAIPTSPLDHDHDAVITLNLDGLDAVRFVGLIGADAFPGDEAQRRMTYAVRTRGKAARFITVIEPYESEPKVVAVQAMDEHAVTVELADGRTQHIAVSRSEAAPVNVRMSEYRAGRLLREERTDHPNGTN